LFLDGKSIVTIGIEVEVARSIAGVLAVVQHGRLTEIKSGSCAVSGLLAVQQIAITKRQRKFDLPARSGCTLVCRYSSQAQALDLTPAAHVVVRRHIGAVATLSLHTSASIPSRATIGWCKGAAVRLSNGRN